MNVTSAEKENPIRFAGSELGAHRHICGFFRNPEEEYHLLLPFIKEGFERGEKAFHVVDPKLRDDHLRRLNSAGINVTEAEKSGQFELCNWEQMYLRDGYWFPEPACHLHGICLPIRLGTDHDRSCRESAPTASRDHDKRLDWHK